jgi:hypothetical protein
LESKIAKKVEEAKQKLAKKDKRGAMLQLKLKYGLETELATLLQLKLNKGLGAELGTLQNTKLTMFGAHCAMDSKTESDAEDGARPFARTAPAAAFAPISVRTHLGQSADTKALCRLFELRAASSIEPQAPCDQDSNDASACVQAQAAAAPSTTEPLVVDAGAVRLSGAMPPAKASAAAMPWASHLVTPHLDSPAAAGQPAAASA